MPKSSTDQLFEQFVKETKDYRCKYFEVLVEKYVKTQHLSDEYDINTLKIVKDKGCLSKITGNKNFGSVSTYFCKSGKETIKQWKKKLVVQRKYALRKYIIEESSSEEDYESLSSGEDADSFTCDKDAESFTSDEGAESSTSDEIETGPPSKSDHKHLPSAKKTESFDEEQSSIPSDKDYQSFSSDESEVLSRKSCNRALKQKKKGLTRDEIVVLSSDDEKQYVTADEEQHSSNPPGIMDCCVRLVKLDINTNNDLGVALSAKNNFQKEVKSSGASTSEKNLCPSPNKTLIPGGELCSNSFDTSEVIFKNFKQNIDLGVKFKSKNKLEKAKRLKFNMKQPKIICEEQVVHINAILSPIKSPENDVDSVFCNSKIKPLPCALAVPSIPKKFSFSSLGIASCKTNHQDFKKSYPFQSDSSLSSLGGKLKQSTLLFKQTKSNKIKEKTHAIHQEENVSFDSLSQEKTLKERKLFTNYSIKTLPCAIPRSSFLTLKGQEYASRFREKILHLNYLTNDDDKKSAPSRPILKSPFLDED